MSCKKEIDEILCRLGMTCIRNSFDIMVDLTIHLVDEIKLDGPVHCHWMFPMEQDWCKLKYTMN